jgi:hypothetical protein
MIRTAILSIALLYLPVTAALAHHSAAAFFDEENLNEFGGEVTSTRWRNPHVVFGVTLTGADGQVEEWSVESNSLNALERIGISPDTVKVGDQIRIWGPISRHGLPSMRAYNILLANGEEVLMMPQATTERRWADRELLSTINVLENKDVTESIQQANGIFRVWTQGRIELINSELPLTPAATAAKAAFNPLTDDPVLNCIPTGMPAVMDVTFPIEFTAQGTDIVLRLEQWDTVRTIHMNGNSNAADNRAATREGYSVGFWDGDTLVVETSNIDWIFFDDRGTPLSSAVEVVERFTLSADQNSLYWQAVTTDPETFTEPAILEQTFTWVPGEEIRPYECTTAG